MCGEEVIWSEPSLRPFASAPCRHLRLDAAPRASALARAFVRELLPDGADDLLSEVDLLTSERVTNAVLHARTELVLILERRDDRVRISVTDGSRATVTLRHYQTDALTGRGLGVVAALSDRWGISAAPDGKVVWAELATAAA